jgi:hypothetical protein
MAEWLEHRQAIKEAQLRQTENRLRSRQEERIRPPMLQPFNGVKFPFERGFVLSELTMWCPNWHLKDEMAEWPELQEMKWEGDDRAKTKVGRFLPLCRWRANPTLAWHQCKIVKTYHFDEVWRPPTLEDIVAPVDEIEDLDVVNLINQDILQAIGSNSFF